ncbi:efflux transporter outer membrane subunit [Aliarcobacter cryaerophilus]|jgi:outer membrane protein, multidrug efflux system|uniref:Efflux transporter outer membrane subunit n=2 Tax=Arcobacteraceae TaxID=2808963 RepID=A0AAU0P610_9BACT|nr:efflux transporter outer membrane subunit [Aliarcobacter cryaerophilus]WNL18055.1 efflux transporter outer membrane subunit [Arcobacter sp. AZ-2023]WPD04472.1 efflux transporter outer membrane subunit [Arcobacter sp. DSM 115972]
MKHNIYSIFLSALILNGCTSSNDLVIPQTEFPLEYSNNANSKSIIIEEQWWKNYQDEKLSLLIEEALKNNHDLQTAMVNISLSRASLSSSTSERYPTLEVQGSTNKIKTSADTFESNIHNKYNNYSLSTVLSYEIDLWGKYKDAQNSAKSSLLASYASRDTVKLALIASVMDNYFTLISLNEQLNVINQIVLAKEEELKRYQTQYNVGSISKIDIYQEKSSLINLDMEKNSIEQSIALQKSALAVLVGKTPKEIDEFCKEIFKEKLPNDITVPLDLPSNLLNNRPDIKQAEENLKSANYNISVAKAMYFPKISLTALVGFESMNSNNLFQSSALKNSLGSSLVSPILNTGKISANVDNAKANMELAEINYKKTVQQAFQEVYDILNKRDAILKNMEHQKTYTKNIEEIYRITQNQYNQGYVDFIALQSAKRNYLSSQTNLIKLNQSLISSTVSLYKALGGGWSKEYLNEIEKL